MHGHFKRRQFLRHMAGFAVFLVLSKLFGKNKAIAQVSDSKGEDPVSIPNGSGKYKVGVGTCDAYDLGEVTQAIQKALQAIGFEIKSDQRVLLKPNIMAHNLPEQHASTHPVVVEAVANLFLEKGCLVTIGDSMAYYQGGGTARALEVTGVAEVAKRTGARLLPFEKTKLRKITTGQTLNPFYVTEAVFEHDVVVNLPKLKLHRLARYTGAIKNVYGCVVGATKALYHTQYQNRPDYQEVWGGPLVDVYEAVNPGLSIMDAIMGLDKDGPAATGEPRKVGVVLASTNGPALDVAACEMIGFDPAWVPAVKAALGRGLCATKGVAVLGALPRLVFAKVPDVTLKKGLSKKFEDYLFHQYLVYPTSARSKCQKCGTCVEQCPVHAVSFDKKGFPKVDYNRCMYCYCCPEYCPYQAMYLSGGMVNHGIRGIRRLLKL